ncbi:MAG: phosphoribosylformylglycinamidine cyclo-ligase [Planctomycetes bacterium]|nr:phosphoribosylformylglycinamidine cyclo-ligase [Planctomycetota bacterium]
MRETGDAHSVDNRRAFGYTPHLWPGLASPEDATTMVSGQTGGDAGEPFRAELLRQLRSTYGPAVIEPENGSAGLYALMGQVGLLERRCRNPVLVAAARGGGPKLALAQAIGRHDAAGSDLVAGCVNEVLARGALPLFFLGHLAAGELDPAVPLQLVKGIAKACRQADCALLGNARDSRPDAFRPGEYDLAGFAVGMVERARVLDGAEKVRAGDLVLGIAASGLGGSGVAQAHRLLVEAGGLRLDAEPPGLGCTLGEELARPTRVHVRSVRAVLERYRVKGVVHGLAHVAEGGLAGALARLAGRRCVARVERASLPRLAVLDLVQRLAGLSDDEMPRAFNMGVGMAAVVAPFYADAAIRRVRRAGDRAAVIGQIASGNGPAAEFV